VIARWAALLVALTVLAYGADAHALVRRYALIVGNDRGDAGDVPLHYAEGDAARVYDVLKDLGGFEPADMVLLRGEDAARARATLISLNDRVRSTIASGAEAVLFVYYSGHAGADALHLSGTRLDLTEVEQLVRGSAATFRVLVLDACRSGAITRAKGGRAAPPFDIRVDERLSEQGLVVLTSSAANEDAQESDALRGSFFTHHLVSALLGGGDADGDGRVTLEEAYRYAYEGTLRSSSETWSGAQHPSFRYELQGAGKLPLTELPVSTQTRATLTFPAGRTYLVIAGSAEGGVVGEIADVARVRHLSVRAGRYFIRGRAADSLLEGEIDAPAGASVDVADDRMRRIAYARLVRKGEGARRMVHGPEAGYIVQTPLRNASTACEGAFAGYAVHFEHLSVGGRIEGCQAAYANDTLRATSDQIGGELRAAHTWDVSVVGFDVGVALGGWLLAQTFNASPGVAAPARFSPAVSLSVAAGMHVDLPAGFSVLAEGAPVVYVYSQAEDGGNAPSFGPYGAIRFAAGVSKTW
jgi:hypothetical protein